MSKTKHGFSAKWKRRRNYKRILYKFNIFNALYLGLYKVEYTEDNMWAFKTRTWFVSDLDYVAMHFSKGTLAECKKQFKESLREYLYKSENLCSRERLVEDVLKDLITECMGYQELITVLSGFNNDEKIIEGLRKLRPQKLN